MILLLAAMAPTPPARVEEVSWLAGHWRECTPRGETSETWTDARGGVMLGISKAVRGDRVDWELARIDTTPQGIALFASPKGQAPTAFRAVSVTAERAIFENRDHDFPQRVIYRRRGDRLTARIEGTVGGQPRAVEWQYGAAALNARCPALRR
jgi:hypothetical protein